MNRRGFFGSIAAIIAAPKAWLAPIRARLPGATGAITITGIPAAPAGVHTRRIYRTNKEGTTYKLIATLDERESHHFVDNDPDNYPTLDRG